MGSNREIERKFVVDGDGSLNHYASMLEHMLKTNAVHGSSIDAYFKPFPTDCTPQFVRLRTEAGVLTLTAKEKDQGTNEDRVEYNHAPLGALDKAYASLIPEPGVEVSLAIVKNHAAGRIYLEVEAPSKKLVTRYVELIGKKIALIEEKRSFFEIFIEEAE